MSNLIKNYYGMGTSKFYRKLGDAILIGCSSLSAAVMGLPLTDNEIKWTIFSLSVIGTLAKVITNFFKDEKSE